MSFFSALKIAGGALDAERMRADLATSNLANANATRSPEGGPYRRRDAVLRSVPTEGAFQGRLERAIRGVRLERVVTDPRPPREVFNPAHPDADERGVVRLPNIQMVEEMVNLLNAQRSYEANLQSILASRDMALRALRIGRTS
jgi:flagellar basal-body rod protein FlgC